MKKKEKDEYNVKFYNSPFLMIGYIFFVVLGWAVFLLVLIPAILYEEVRAQFVERPILAVIIVFMCIVLPELTVICLMPKTFLRIEISERGVESSLFRVFCKRHFAWDEIQEIKYMSWAYGWIFLSKIKGETDNKTVQQLSKNKRLLQIQLTPKVYRAITHYYEKPIVGLPQRTIDYLTKKK